MTIAKGKFISRKIYTHEILYARDDDDIKALNDSLIEIRYQQNLFKQISFEERKERLFSFANVLRKNKDLFSMMICEEVGRNIKECQREIERSIELIKYYGDIFTQTLKSKKMAIGGDYGLINFEPLGIIFAVMPWNYPIWQIFRFSIPALFTGNGCLVKPAPSVGRVTEKLFQLVDKEIPFRAVFLNESHIEQAISMCDGFAFTGSIKTGKKLASLAGKYLKKMVLELGGSNALLVLEDADIKLAAKDACYSRFKDSGQNCNAIKRIILLPENAEKFLYEFKILSQTLQSGNPENPDNTLVPLHQPKSSLKLQKMVDDAVKQGSKIVLGGYLPVNKDFYPATIIDHVNVNLKIAQEEIFGPVAVVFRAQNIEEAIKIAEASEFGLGISIYSKNRELAWEIGKKINVGNVYINKYPSSHFHLPFGGVKNSGFGRELSEFGLMEFVNIKSYWER